MATDYITELKARYTEYKPNSQSSSMAQLGFKNGYFMRHLWRPEDNFWISVLSFSHVGAGTELRTSDYMANSFTC